MTRAVVGFWSDIVWDVVSTCDLPPMQPSTLAQPLHTFATRGSNVDEAPRAIAAFHPSVQVDALAFAVAPAVVFRALVHV